LYLFQAIYFFFFFQAEDGIRDRNVTGVQTCALPISPWSQTKCSTKLSYFPKSAPERSRTPNLLIRSQTLYPIELRAHMLLWCRGLYLNRHGGITSAGFLVQCGCLFRHPGLVSQAEGGIRIRAPPLGKIVCYR